VSWQNKCSKCKNSGWVLYVDEHGFRRAGYCDCIAGIRNAMRKTGLPEHYFDCTFDNFTIKIRGKENIYLKKAKTVLREFAEFFGLKKEQKGILLKGTIGCGKTHLCAALTRRLIERGLFNVLFIDFKELLENIKATFSYGSYFNEQDILYPIQNTSLLIIDDLGSERNTEWTEDVFARILNYRYNRNLPVVITTNYFDRTVKGALSDELLEERIGARMRSRLYEMCRDIEIISEDYRKIIKR